MQLRVARLCLDCEELHADKRCPRCASASYAFLTNWLPCDERRQSGRERRSTTNVSSRFGAVVQSIARWFRGEIDRPAPATRRSDLISEVPKHDERGERAAMPMAAEPQTAETVRAAAATEQKEIASRAS